MGSLSAAGLLGVPVRLHGIMLGRSIDLVLDAGARRVLGFIVESGDDAPRFLPYAASQPASSAIAVGSALMLLDDVSFYRTRGTSFRALLGGEIEREHVPAGALVDMHVGHAGEVLALEVEADGTRASIPAAGSRFSATAATAA